MPTKLLTLTAFLAMPETKPTSEYIDGQLLQKPMPQGKRSALQSDLIGLINAAARAQKVVRAFPELRCTFGGSAIVPDMAVFVWARIQREQNGEIVNVFPLAPDWAIEILSSGQGTTKVTKKLLHWVKHRSQMGWLIALEDRAALVYRPPQAVEICDQPDALLPMPDFMDELSLTTAALFD
ncbi:MAG: Uma2 family endonuclease [Cyanobacteria bacterium J06554_11]